MSDAAVRSLERAVAGGDAIARVPLATAYLRQGRAAAALGVLEDARDPDATAVHDAAWRRALGGLALVEPVVPGVAPDARLVGWFGAEPRADRFAALATSYASHRPRLVDVDRLQLLGDAALPPGHVPAATSRHALFCWNGGQLVRLAPPLEEGRPWRHESTFAQRPTGLPVLADPAGRRVLLGDDAMHVVASFPDLDTITLAGADAAQAVDWARERVVFWKRRDARLQVQPFARGVGPGFVELRRAFGPGREPPWRDGTPPTFELLDDGRLLVGPPLLVVDLDTGALAAPRLPPGVSRRLQGPVRLSRDRHALLLLADGKPLRAPLVAGERPTLALDPEPARAVWHPAADLVAAEALERGLPELRAADGATVRLLPRDARPLGWSPDGRTLLVLRRQGEAMAVLEAWRAPSEVAS